MQGDHRRRPGLSRGLAETARGRPGRPARRHAHWNARVSRTRAREIFNLRTTMTSAIRSSVFVGTSLDGFIARPNGDFDFLAPWGGEEHGYHAFMATVDTLVMGRKTS